MDNTILHKEDVKNSLEAIIQEIAGVKIDEPDICLFNAKYNISSELFIYILLKASREFSFDVNDEFVGLLTSYSFNNLLDSIMNHI